MTGEGKLMMNELPAWAAASPSDALSPELKLRIGTALGLSPRETEIAFCMLAGVGRKGIATRVMILWELTVDSHIRRIYTKLHVTSAAAVAGMILLAYMNLT